MNIQTTCLLGALLCTGVAQATEPVKTFDWAVMAEAGRLSVGAELVSDHGRNVVLVRHTAMGPLVVPLLSVDDPGVSGMRWEVRGDVRYEGIAAASFLELWSVFPDGARYVSRTAAHAGSMAVLQGSSDWRRFVVPFTSNPETPPPTRLELNLVLQGVGTVWIGPVELIEPYGESNPVEPKEAWWAERQGGLVGGVVGSVLGVLGALVGVMTTLGRGRTLVRAILAGFVIVGAFALAAAVAAFVGGQPRGVWYPIGLPGLIVCVVGAVMWGPVNRRYADAEDRRIRAMDL